MVEFTPQSFFSHTKARGPRSCLGVGEEKNLLPVSGSEANVLGYETSSLLATLTEVYRLRIVNKRREKSTKL